MIHIPTKARPLRCRQSQIRRLKANTACKSNDPIDKATATKQWFQTCVIDQKLCPFAIPLLKNDNLIRFVSSPAQTSTEAVSDVKREIQELLAPNHGDHETTLVIFDNKTTFVKDYLEFVRFSWILQEQAVGIQFQEHLQLVLFHPLATHQTYSAYDTAAADDENLANAGDYTIRSPYPTIHLLKEIDVLKAVQSGYPDLEYLPTRNKNKLSEQGLKVCQKRLEDCYAFDFDTPK